MKHIVGRRRRRTLVVIGLAVAGSMMLLSAPAHAGGGAKTGNEGVQFRYAPVQFSGNRTHVVWHWTLTNAGGQRASKVVLTHRLDQAMKVTGVSAPCTTQGTVVTCPFDELRPGDEQRGFIEADLPPNQTADMQINGQVVWEAPVSGAPETGTPVVG